MKKLLLIAMSLIWVITLSLMMTKAFAWEHYDERTALNSDYNKAESNPTNYHKDEGYGMTRAY